MLYEEYLKEQLRKHRIDEKTMTVLFKVRLFMDSHEVHNCLVSGRSQVAVVEQLMPALPEVLTIQTFSGNMFAVRSEKISAIEFVED